MKIRTTFVVRYLLITLLALLLLDVLLVIVESGHPKPLISSFGEAVWYTLVTLAAVGYGDYYPLTPEGRVIGYLFVLGSIALLGIIISMVSKNIYTMIEERKLGYRGTSFKDHIIVIGWNNFSRSVVNEVLNSKRKIAVITDKKDDVDLIHNTYDSKNVFVLFSDFHNLEALVKAQPNQASQVFVNLHNDTDALMYVVNFRKYYPAPELVVSIDNSSLEETFITAGVTYVVSRNEIASKLVASYIFEPDVAHINLDILSCARNKDEHDNQEFKVTRSNPYLNRKYLDAFVDMKKKYNAVLLGIYKSSSPGKLKTNPEDDVMIELGDYLIMMVSGRHREKIETEFGITQGRMV